MQLQRRTDVAATISADSRTRPNPGPTILAYDGSHLAAYAIERAAQQLGSGREAIVVCVWRPCDVGFTPVDRCNLRAAAANEVRRAADQTAAHGVEIARQAGFEARARTVEAAPTWKGLVKVAGECGCGLIVIGSHRRGGLTGFLAGSVATATAMHFEDSVLIVHRPY